MTDDELKRIFRTMDDEQRRAVQVLVSRIINGIVTLLADDFIEVRETLDDQMSELWGENNG